MKTNKQMDEKYFPFMAGFDLAARRTPDGLQSLVDDTQFLDEWPNEIEFGTETYGLENVKVGVDGYECAMYA